jgi:hypothetical protein
MRDIERIAGALADDVDGDEPAVLANRGVHRRIDASSGAARP